MVWYLRDFKQANFHGHIIDSTKPKMNHRERKTEQGCGSL
jgi:hypothetical protein